MTKIAPLLTSQPGGFCETERTALEAARRILRRRLRATDVISSWAMLTEFLAINAVGERVEVFRVLFLNTKHHLICDEIMGRGTIDHTPVYVREVLRRALEVDASAIILCHNHPSGDVTPSKEDIKITKRIKAACDVLEIRLHDHVIVGFGRETQTVSLRAFGHI